MFGIKKIKQDIEAISDFLTGTFASLGRRYQQDETLAASRYNGLKEQLDRIESTLSAQVVANTESETDVYTDKKTGLLNYKNYTLPGKKTTTIPMAKKGEY